MAGPSPALRVPLKRAREEDQFMESYLEMLERLQHIHNLSGNPEIGETIRRAEAALRTR